jgi:hypothetical protein
MRWRYHLHPHHSHKRENAGRALQKLQFCVLRNCLAAGRVCLRRVRSKQPGKDHCGERIAILHSGRSCAKLRRSTINRRGGYSRVGDDNPEQIRQIGRRCRKVGSRWQAWLLVRGEEKQPDPFRNVALDGLPLGSVLSVSNPRAVAMRTCNLSQRGQWMHSIGSTPSR